MEKVSIKFRCNDNSHRSTVDLDISVRTGLQIFADRRVKDTYAKTFVNSLRTREG